LFVNYIDVQFSVKINCCQSLAANNEGVFLGPTQGPYILQLYMGLSHFWRGLTHSDPPLFRTLYVGLHNVVVMPTERQQNNLPLFLSCLQWMFSLHWEWLPLQQWQKRIFNKCSNKVYSRKCFTI